ncbi:type 1 fimbrial major subunit FimA [Dickeya lacustris]|uniref:Type 1 fimbrial major subunit FimA n=1 Tax=Dickeya lacustris TaxID=2259638 RepID=A0ABY8GAT4_9GAMM|nr:type 1 fimbrial major subunit FimA [Dickeya lacustris]WFN57022.1 type 1 fimbrial major subunit FimA [Dickeya lacustris]
MKFNSLAIGILSALTLSSVAHAALSEFGRETPAKPSVVTVNGGTVHFKGEVVNAACAVDAGSVDQTVQLGQVRSAKLASAGSTSSAVGFNIKLNDCDTTIASKASVAFSGSAVSTKYENVLALQSSAAGGATNVGVQILDGSGSPLALNGTGFSAPVTLNDGSNTLPFQARYYATGAATAGVANADATFKVQYQ